LPCLGEDVHRIITTPDPGVLDLTRYLRLRVLVRKIVVAKAFGQVCDAANA
jgi:hypothetical protein